MKYRIYVEVAMEKDPSNSWTEDWGYSKFEAAKLSDIAEYAQSVISAYNTTADGHSRRSLIKITKVGLLPGATLDLSSTDTPPFTEIVAEAGETTGIEVQRSIDEVLELREFLEDGYIFHGEAVNKTLDWLFDPDKTLDLEELKDTIDS